jgi:hypothetical protein
MYIQKQRSIPPYKEITTTTVMLNLELVAPGFRSTLGVKFHAEITVDGEVPVGPARRGGIRDDTVRVVVAKARICMAVVARSGR